MHACVLVLPVHCVRCVLVVCAVLEAVCHHQCLPLPPFSVQGDFTLARVLALLKQVLAALLHLHSLGILHRDLRAANILITSLDPVHAVVADFGVSHLLSAFSGGAGAGAGRAADLTAGKVHTVLRGGAALGPVLVCVCMWSCLFCPCRNAPSAAHFPPCLRTRVSLGGCLAVERPRGVCRQCRGGHRGHHCVGRVHGGRLPVRAADLWHAALPLACHRPGVEPVAGAAKGYL